MAQNAYWAFFDLDSTLIFTTFEDQVKTKLPDDVIFLEKYAELKGGPQVVYTLRCIIELLQQLDQMGVNIFIVSAGDGLDKLGKLLDQCKLKQNVESVWRTEKKDEHIQRIIRINNINPINACFVDDSFEQNQSVKALNNIETFYFTPQINFNARIFPYPTDTSLIPYSNLSCATMMYPKECDKILDFFKLRQNPEIPKLSEEGFHCPDPDTLISFFKNDVSYFSLFKRVEADVKDGNKSRCWIWYLYPYTKGDAKKVKQKYKLKHVNFQFTDNQLEKLFDMYRFEDLFRFVNYNEDGTERDLSFFGGDSRRVHWWRNQYNYTTSFCEKYNGIVKLNQNKFLRDMAVRRLNRIAGNEPSPSGGAAAAAPAIPHHAFQITRAQQPGEQTTPSNETAILCLTTRKINFEKLKDAVKSMPGFKFIDSYPVHVYTDNKSQANCQFGNQIFLIDPHHKPAYSNTLNTTRFDIIIIDKSYTDAFVGSATWGSATLQRLKINGVAWVFDINARHTTPVSFCVDSASASFVDMCI